MSVYDQPLYYEIAFSYQEVKRQADYFEEVARKHSRVKVKRFLDICCGPSPQLRELARRGYEAVGLDISPKMLEHLKLRANEEGVRVETVEADMNDFKLNEKCDFTFVLSGSVYVDSNKQFLQHLDCVADALNSGGLHLFENFPLRLYESRRQEWTMTRGQIEVGTVFETKVKDELEQLYEDKVMFEVKDKGENRTFSSVVITKNIAPQELRALIELNRKFEFIGWFEHLTLEPLRTLEGDNVVILRKK